MALSDFKILDSDVTTKGVAAAPDKLTGDPAENKAVFDRLIRECVKLDLNGLIDALVSASGAGDLGAKAKDGAAASTVQAELNALNKASTGAGNVPTGGAAGQVLKKASGTSFDTVWGEMQDIINASGIHKGDGVGGVSAADAAALKTLLDTLSAVSPATDDKIPLTDISGAAAGYSTIADVLALVTPGAQIAVGTYTGTGVFGSPNKNSLTFPFTPKLVMIMHAQHGFCGIGDCFSVRWGLSTAPRLWIDGGQYTNQVAAYSGNTMTWYENSYASRQLNESGAVYAYIAFT